MYRNRSVKITTLHDKTLYGAIHYIKTGKVKANNVMFQIGSNDLEHKDPDDVLIELEQLVKTTKEALPEVNVLIGEILPRFYQDRSLSSEYEQKRMSYNCLVKEFCNEIGAHFVTYDNLKFIDFVDGIHLNEVGVRIFVSNMKRVFNPLLGVVHVSENENKKKFRFYT